MKKLLSLLIAVVSMFAFSGCFITFEDYYQPSQSVEQIKNIYVYDIEEYIYYYNYYQDNSIFPAHFAEVESSDFAVFIQDMEAILYEDSIMVVPPVASDPNTDYYGYVVKVEYRDGGYDMIASGLRTSYSIEDGLKAYWGSSEENWLSTLEKYVDIEEV